MWMTVSSTAVLPWEDLQDVCFCLWLYCFVRTLYARMFDTSGRTARSSCNSASSNLDGVTKTRETAAAENVIWLELFPN